VELVLKINSSGDSQTQYQDGDIIEAFSDTRIHFCHAEMICHHDKFSFNENGLRDHDTLLEKLLQKMSKYRFVRLNATEVKRINLLSLEESVINDTPNADGEHMNVAQFVKRRVAHPKHKVFGTSGSEVWYGGNSSRDRATCDAIWNDIETHSDNLQVDHSHWPLSSAEKTRCLPLNCVGWDSENSLVREISNSTAGERRGSVTREVPHPEDSGETITETVAKRQWQVPYWDLAAELGVNIDDVRNLSKTVDARSDAPAEDRNHVDDVNLDKVEEGIVVP
jgi:hypothetical protein